MEYLIGIYLAKKALIYSIARAYGWPKIYRKMLKWHRKLDYDTDQQKHIKKIIAKTFRLPNKIYYWIKELNMMLIN